MAVTALVCVASPSSAALRAHLYVWDVTDIGSVSTTDEDDPFVEEGPTFAEPFWVAAIFEEGDQDFASHQWTDPSCDVWTAATTLVVDQEFSAVIPDKSQARFHLSLYDYDNYPTSQSPAEFREELIGDHEWPGTHDVAPPKAPEPNANNGCCYQTGTPGSPICADYPAGLGAAGNFTVNLRSWYEDTTPPSGATGLAHDGADPTLNDDPVLSFAWAPGQDANSGTSQRIVLERQSDGGTCEVELPEPAQSTFALQGSIGCDTGSTITTLPLENGESYRARIDTRNGVTPVIENWTSVSSAVTPWVLQGASGPAVPALGPLGTLALSVALAASISRIWR